MRRSIIFVLITCALMFSFICAGISPVKTEASDGMNLAKIYGVKMLWNSSMQVNDVAVSEDGNYLAAVNDTGLYYFASHDSTPRWWYLRNMTVFESVAISADGQFVVAGNRSGYVHFFKDSTVNIGQLPSSTWISERLGSGGSIARGTLDMSDDGVYIAVGASGGHVCYFSGCNERSGAAEDPTWQGTPTNVCAINAMRISSDGRYVAVAGNHSTGKGFVLFYKDANSAPYPTEPSWYAYSSLRNHVVDMELSDDGYAVVGVGCGPLHYWANATILNGDPDATWTNPVGFACVDMSSDGSSVVTGTTNVTSLRYWANSRERQGAQTEDWGTLDVSIRDLAISDDGGVMVAYAIAAGHHKAFFLKSDASIIGEFDLQYYSPLVSMSGNGRIAAVGGSLHVFEVLEDLTPPSIRDVSQQPAAESVQPDDEVTVYANVTDEESGVKNAILNYTNGDGMWVALDMVNQEGDTWNATIPAFPFCTYVNYTIAAEDNVGNSATTEEIFGYQYQYHVIPEFPLLLIQPLFATTSLIALMAWRKRRLSNQNKTQI